VDDGPADRDGDPSVHRRPRIDAPAPPPRPAALRGRARPAPGACLREALQRHEGYEVDREGDSFFVAFAQATAAVAAASEAQEALARAEWHGGGDSPGPDGDPHRRGDSRSAEVRRARRAPCRSDHGRRPRDVPVEDRERYGLQQRVWRRGLW
jgi:hypothetical protein